MQPRVMMCRETLLRSVCRRLYDSGTGVCASSSSSSVKGVRWNGVKRVMAAVGDNGEVWSRLRPMTSLWNTNHLRGCHPSSVHPVQAWADGEGSACCGLRTPVENWRHSTSGNVEKPLPSQQLDQQRCLRSLPAGLSASAAGSQTELMHLSAAPSVLGPHREHDYSSSLSISLSSKGAAARNTLRQLPFGPDVVNGAAHSFCIVVDRLGQPRIVQKSVLGGEIYCRPFRTMAVPERERRGLAVALPDQLGYQRSYSKLQVAEPRLVQVRVYMQSPGVIGEPYRRPELPLPFFQRWLTKEGWRRRRKQWMDTLKTAYTVAKLRRESKGYRKTEFYNHASALYSEVSKAIADGDRTALRQLVTEAVFTELKKEIKQREEAGWQRVSWKLASVPEIRTAQARLVGVDPKNTDRAFAQITLLIRSKQKFGAYDRHGRLVAGDPDKQIDVEDCWVFERRVDRSDQKWRLCGRLTL
ncbi:hypothetical protein CBR_g37761 [Chara braunii]|uniref:Large ribosomal subunit protein mL45 n=1 Tax=Chara braunii TaxID=69332 RepID=A0A388LNP7_CHABU|nr:hypothetical protein CBR_g37761 [Chara braunii]|eukprot:GBG83891.1 hypothetical protein CBR_g37761 [Chara braunii]